MAQYLYRTIVRVQVRTVLATIIRLLTHNRSKRNLSHRLPEKPSNTPCGRTSCIWNTGRSSSFVSHLSNRKCHTDPEAWVDFRLRDTMPSCGCVVLLLCDLFIPRWLMCWINDRWSMFDDSIFNNLVPMIFSTIISLRFRFNCRLFFSVVALLWLRNWE